MRFWPFGKKTTAVEPPVFSVPESSTLPTQDVHLLAAAQMVAEGIRNNRASWEEYQIASAYASIYSRVTDDRKRTIREVEKMRSFYLVDTIISMLVEDSLAPEVGTGEILNVKSDRPDIQKELDYLDETFDFDMLAQTLAPDIVAYGDYVLATKVVASPDAQARAEKGEALNADATGEDDKQYGLIEILDTVEQGSVVPLTKYANTEGYLVSSKRGGVERKLPADYVTFSMNSARVRIDLHREFGIDSAADKEKFEDVPRYVRCGKSVIFPILSKLKELELLEAMVPATKLAKLSSGTVLGVQVPPGYDTEKGIEAARKVEQLLNKKIGVDNKLGELTIENIMASAGRQKVIPIFGDKGTIAAIDYKSNEPDEMLNSIADLRKAILTSAGIPPELLFSNENPDGAATILKKYARYLRRLKALQKALEEGFRQIAYIHLANKGIKFKATDIKVEFYNKLIEVDQLDHLEFADTTIQMVQNVYNFMNTLTSRETNPVFAPYVNPMPFMNFIQKHLDVVGFQDVVNMEKFAAARNAAVAPKPSADPVAPAPVAPATTNPAPEPAPVTPPTADTESSYRAYLKP